MWVAHFAPGLAAKPLVPNIPIWVLALAGAMPDALHFVLNLLRVESFNLDPELTKRGCFPYSNDYPYTHSLLGMAVAGVACAAVYTFFTDRKVTPRDQLTIVGVTLSHFFLELPAHRRDVKLTPRDNQALGAGLFDHPAIDFVVEMLILYTGFLVWGTASLPFAKAGAQQNPRLPTALLAFFAVQQAIFCFGSAPTSESRFIHAPIFLGEILLSSFLLGKLDDQSAHFPQLRKKAEEVVKKIEEVSKSKRQDISESKGKETSKEEVGASKEKETREDISAKSEEKKTSP